MNFRIKASTQREHELLFYRKIKYIKLKYSLRERFQHIIPFYEGEVSV